MPLTLYPHQEKAIENLYTFFKGNPTGHPVIEAPTGAGKSLIQAEFIRGVLAKWPRQRILCATHVRELVQQNHAEMLGQWPDAPAGVYCAGLKSRDTASGILFCSIQSIHARTDEIGHIDLMFIDEAHLCPVRTSDGMYRTLIDKLTAINPKLRVIGMTATPYRLDNGSLNYGENALFTDIIPAKASGMTVAALIDEGFLSPLTTLPVSTGYDLTGVSVRGGDYTPGELSRAVDVDHITRAACAEIIEIGKNRASWLVFATDVEHAYHIAAAIKEKGIECGVVTGKTKSDKRADTLARFKNQTLRCLVNVNCLTTGFNARGVDLIAFMRPSQSAALYCQMAGRGLRLSPETNKTDCLVLDFAGLISEHGPITSIRPPRNKREKEKGATPVQECPECYFLMPIAATICPFCGHEIVREKEIKITDQASDLDIMGVRLQEIAITSMVARVHLKEGSPSSLRVDYFAGYSIAATEWVCLFHVGYAKKVAQKWWLDHLPGDPYPVNIGLAFEAVNERARCPNRIRLKPLGRYQDIVWRGFAEPIEHWRAENCGQITEGMGDLGINMVDRARIKRGIKT